MTRIICPLRPQTRRPEVGDLQDGLSLLLEKGLLFPAEAERQAYLKRLSPERSESTFGPTTEGLVRAFQEHHRLESSGVVDERTAAVLNAVLEELGAFAPADPGGAPARPGAGPGGPRNDPATPGDDTGRSEDETGGRGFIVRGTVTDAAGRPFTAGSVRAEDVDMRSRELLGETSLDGTGSYVIRYRPEQFQRAEKERADLRVAVCNDAGLELVASDTIFNAAAEEVVNFVVESDADRLSEYERHVAELTPLVQRVPFEELEEKDVRFLAGETGIPAARIAFLATAHRHAKATGVEEPAAFYGFFRDDLPTNLSALLLTPPARLAQALERTAAAGVIPATLAERADRILEQLSAHRGRRLLETEGREGFTVRDLLAQSGAEDALQEEFLDLYVRRDGSLEEFWTSLEEDPRFQKAGAVESFRFVLQTGLLTGHNAALVGALQELRGRGEIGSVEDLTAWDGDRWESLIESIRDGGVPLPEGLPGETESERVHAYAGRVREAVRQSFPTLAVRHGIAADDRLDEHVRADLVRFFDNARDFDFRDTSVRAYLEKSGETAFDGIEDRDATIQTAKRIERLFHVTPRYEHIKVLLDAGLDSAFAVSAMPLGSFVRDFADALGGEMQARSYYGAAQTRSSMSMALAAQIKQGLFDPAPAAVGGKGGGEAVAAALKTMPTLEGLFGSLDLCECRHCRSVYGPAAYFTDLLQFLRKSGGTAFNVLRNRRPDLEHIKLTCENSHTPLPYVDLVNEALEFYVDNGALDQGLAHDTEGITADELSVNPQYVSDTAYDKLLEPVHGFRLPFNRPLEVVRAYLAHLGSSRHELMTAFANANGASEVERAAEYLGFSPEKFTIVAGHSTAAAHEFYGWTTDAPPLLKIHDSGTFVRILQRKLNAAGADPSLEVDGIFDDATETALETFQQANGLPVNGETGPDTWQALSSFPPDAMTAALGHVPDFLQRAEIEYTELVELLKTRFVNPDQVTDPYPDATVVLYSPDSVCDLDQTWIERLDGGALEGEWKDFHRFLRLWKKLGWTMQELDKAIHSLNGASLDDDVLLDVARVQWLRSELKLPVTELLTLWSEKLDTFGPGRSAFPDDAKVTEPSLYERLFLNRAVLNPPDGAFELTGAATPEVVGGETLSGHERALCAALRMSASELSALRQATGLDDPQTPLTLGNVTKLLRHALLARALRLSIEDHLSLLVLLGVDAGQPLSPTAAVELVERARAVEDSGFSVAELEYLYRHRAAPGSGVAPSREQVDALLAGLRSELQTLSDETAPVRDATGDIVRERLTAVLDAAAVDDAVALIEGTSSLAQAEKEAFIETHFASFLDPALAKVELELGSALGPEDAQANRDYVLPPLLAHIRETTSRDRIEQMLAESLSLERDVVRRLLVDILENRNAQPLLADFMALSGDGLAAEYFANEDLTGTPDAERIDALVAFEWPDEAPDPNIAPGGFSARWQGHLVPAQDDVVTFHVRASGGVRLWVGDLLAPAVDEWSSGGGTVEQAWTSPEPLRGGRAYAIRLEYTHASGGPAGIELSWSSRSTPRAPIPQSRLYSSAAFATYDTLASSYTLLHKVAVLVNGFDGRADELVYLADHGADFEGLDFDALPLSRENAQQVDDDAPALFAQWEALAAYFDLRNRLPRHDLSLLDVVAAPDADKAETLASLTGWELADIEFLCDPARLDLPPAEFRDATAPARLRAAFELARRTGVSAQALWAWAQAAPDADQARQLVQAVKARYDEKAWREVARPLNDALREKQKQALVAYVLADENIAARGIGTADQLYQYFLIDVGMDPCFMTSRLKQAAASVQLFVQRCLMNLEPDVSPSSIDAERWEWMKNYRVWEANRKVFLYPENWIEPELRDDRTPFFRDLENQLLQGEITDENVESALVSYMQQLDDVARLSPVGLFVDPDDRKLLHVFARTTNEPRIYYYRRFHRGTESWTPWEKVELDIEGDHLIPVVWNRRLYLFWPIFTEATDPTAQCVPVDDSCIALPEGAPPVTHWEIGLAWSEFRKGRWSPKKSARDKVVSEPVWHRHMQDWHVKHVIEPRRHYFWPEISDGTLTVYCFREYVDHLSAYVVTTDSPTMPGMFLWSPPHLQAKAPLSGHARVGAFHFPGCGADVRVWSDIGRPLADRDGPQGSVNDGMGFLYSSTKGHLTLAAPGEVEVLGMTPDPYTFLAPNDRVDLAQPYYPFLFEDAKRVYLAAPAQEEWRMNEPPLRITVAAHTEFVYDLSHDPEQTSRTLDFAPSFFVGSGGSGRTFRASALRNASLEMVSAGIGSPEADATESFLPDPQTDVVTYSGGAPDFATSTGSGDAIVSAIEAASAATLQTVTRFKFHGLFHPHVCALFKSLNNDGIPGLLTLENQELSSDPFWSNRFKTTYDPAESVHTDYPRENVDFDGGAYSVYNWELFFHAPLMLADALRREQRYEDALKWLHRIFDPTADAGGGPVPRRYWKFLPFRVNDESGRILDLLEALNHGDPAARKRLVQQVEDWRDNPFEPHRIARMRLMAYQKKVVSMYIETLIAWGDRLFLRDTIESINEATQLYVLAAELLGERPATIPRRGHVEPMTYAELRPKLDAFSNAVVELENAFPFSSVDSTTSNGGAAGTDGLGTATAFYFCLPANEKLLGLWDTVEDRLFKIRHCMNIEGVTRQLPLFEPPIDPALLVRARAMGLDIGSVLDDLSAPLAPYRFQTMVQKATELCAEVKSLGGALLAALEKKDAEEMASLRARHETHMLKLAKEVRKDQIREANESLAALKQSRGAAETRETYYRRNLEGGLNAQEKLQLEKLDEANRRQEESTYLEIAAQAASNIPNFTTGTDGPAPVVTAGWGGSNLASALSATARFWTWRANNESYKAGKADIQGRHTRRADEWALQQSLAAHDIAQIDRQIVAAEIRLAIAEKELANHEQQIENSREVEEFLSGKYTNRELYGWMVGQLSGVYFQTYKLAYDAAKRAEKAYRRELGMDTSDFIRFGYWDDLRRGLLAGERLQLDLKRMEMAYVTGNRRELEIARPISLLTLDPMKLIELKETGACEVEIPEALFDMDYPGHYMRRIKSVALTLPCVVGPYTGVNCTLTLLSSKIRRDPGSRVSYGEQRDENDPGVDDPRFEYRHGARSSIATSHGRADAGLFELSFRDERYLPFEGEGAISRWRLELPRETNAFDLDSLSDVVLHVNYTARDGGELLRTAAASDVAESLATEEEPWQRLFSARHEFPDAWHRFLHPRDSETAHLLELELSKERLPFRFRNADIALRSMRVLLKLKEETASDGIDLPFVLAPDPQAESSGKHVLGPHPVFHALHAQVFDQAQAPLGAWSVTVDEADIENTPALRTGVMIDGDNRWRLDPDAVEDLWVYVEYTAQ